MYQDISLSMSGSVSYQIDEEIEELNIKVLDIVRDLNQ